MNLIRSIAYGRRQVKLLETGNKLYQVEDNKEPESKKIFYVSYKHAKEVYDKKEEEVYNDSKV